MSLLAILTGRSFRELRQLITRHAAEQEQRDRKLREILMATKEQLEAVAAQLRTGFNEIKAGVAGVATEVGETATAVGALKTKIEELIEAGSIPDAVVADLQAIADEAGTLSESLTGSQTGLDALQEHPVPPPVEEPPVEG